MLPIFIISSKAKYIEPLVSGSLGKLGTVMRCSSKEVFCGGEPDYLVFASGLERIEAAKGIAVLFDPAPKKLVLSRGILPIFLSGDKRAVRLLKGCENPAICCGCSAKDSIAMASRASGRILMSVQREFTDIFGNVTEPCEYSFCDPGGDLRRLILCASVLIACGCSEQGEICGTSSALLA